MSNILNSKQIELIKISGHILAESMNVVVAAIKPDISTHELDRIAEEEIRRRHGIPSFLNYHVFGIGRYPASLCISINEEIVHGIPSKHRFLKEGDIVSLDLGVGYQGIFSDMAVTVPVGKVSKDAQKLIEITEKSLQQGIEEAKAGNTIGDIGASIQKVAENEGFGIVRDYVGHGIGTQPHLGPQIPNYGIPGTGPKILEGMALAIEPMVTLGNYDTEVGEDRWVVKTADASLAAHFEHTVVIIDGKPVVVTK